jgi:putative hydrolase of the HAD superfamily
MTPRALLLDVGGVLLLPDPEIVRPFLARAAGVAPDEQALDRAHYGAIAAASRMSSPDWDVYFRRYAALAGVGPTRLPEAADGLRAAFALPLWRRVVPGAVGLLHRWRARGVRVVLVSNSDGTVEASLGKLGVCQVGEGPGVPVDAILDSDVVGLAKPDPQFFALALRRAGVAAGEALHVGDSLHADVVGATAAGIRALHFTPYGGCDDGRHGHLARLEDLVAGAE